MNTYECTTRDGHVFTITAYGNFHAGTKAASIGGGGVSVKLISKYRVPGLSGMKKGNSNG